MTAVLPDGYGIQTLAEPPVPLGFVVTLKTKHSQIGFVVVGGVLINVMYLDRFAAVMANYTVHGK